MDDDFIRQQIASLAGQDRRGQYATFGRILADCWPGGSSDRVVPIALSWLRHWRPAKVGAGLPVCTCAAGRCRVCN